MFPEPSERLRGAGVAVARSLYDILPGLFCTPLRFDSREKTTYNGCILRSQAFEHR
jgi:hypothetical protein